MTGMRLPDGSTLTFDTWRDVPATLPDEWPPCESCGAEDWHLDEREHVVCTPCGFDAGEIPEEHAPRLERVEAP